MFRVMSRVSIARNGMNFIFWEKFNGEFVFGDLFYFF